MTRTVLFDSPFLLGFEHTRNLIERAAKAAAESYPPYNVEDVGEGRVRITLAVAGFAPEQLQVTVEDNQLIVAGRKDADRSPDKAPAEERAYLHRGIAARGFVRGFVLADGLEVTSAALEDGLLTIEAVRPPAARSVRTVPIRAA